MGSGQSKTVKIGSVKCKVIAEVQKTDNQSVYRVIDNKTKAEYLLTKTVIAKDRTSTLDYLSEVDILSRLPPHPNIVRYIGSSHLRHANGNVEFAILTDDSGSVRLDEMLNDNRLSETTLKIKCFEDVCLAIKHCHDNGIAHLKIIPMNILVDAFGTFKLSNFSFATTVSNTNNSNGMQYPQYSSHFTDPELSYHGSKRNSLNSQGPRSSFTKSVTNGSNHEFDIYDNFGNDDNGNVFDKNKLTDEKSNNEKNNHNNNNNNSNNNKNKDKNDKNDKNDKKKNKNKNNKNKNDNKKKDDSNNNNSKKKKDENKKKKGKNKSQSSLAGAKLIFGMSKAKSSSKVQVGFMAHEESKDNSSIFQNDENSQIKSPPLSNGNSNTAPTASQAHVSANTNSNKLDSEIWSAPELVDPKLVSSLLSNRKLFTAADIWSLGVLLTYLLYNKLPHLVTRTSGITEAVLPNAIASATSSFIQKKMMHADNRRRIDIDRVVSFIKEIAKDPLLLASHSQLVNASDLNSLNNTRHNSDPASYDNGMQFLGLVQNGGNNSVSGSNQIMKSEATLVKLEDKSDTSHFHIIDDLTNQIMQCDLIFQNRFFARLMLNFWKYPMNAMKMKMNNLNTLSNFESEIFERVYTVANYLAQKNSMTALKLLILLHRLHLQTPKQFCLASIGNIQFYERILITWQQDTSGDSFAPLLIPYSQYIVRRLQFHQEWDYFENNLSLSEFMYEHHANNYEILDINEWFDDTLRSFGDLIDLGSSLLTLIGHMLSVYKKEMAGEARKRVIRNGTVNTLQRKKSSDADKVPVKRKKNEISKEVLGVLHSMLLPVFEDLYCLYCLVTWEIGIMRISKGKKYTTEISDKYKDWISALITVVTRFKSSHLGSKNGTWKRIESSIASSNVTNVSSQRSIFPTVIPKISEIPILEIYPPTSFAPNLSVFTKDLVNNFAKMLRETKAPFSFYPKKIHLPKTQTETFAAKSSVELANYENVIEDADTTHASMMDLIVNKDFSPDGNQHSSAHKKAKSSGDPSAAVEMGIMAGAMPGAIATTTTTLNDALKDVSKVKSMAKAKSVTPNPGHMKLNKSSHVIGLDRPGMKRAKSTKNVNVDIVGIPQNVNARKSSHHQRGKSQADINARGSFLNQGAPYGRRRSINDQATSPTGQSKDDSQSQRKDFESPSIRNNFMNNFQRAFTPPPPMNSNQSDISVMIEEAGLFAPSEAAGSNSQSRGQSPSSSSDRNDDNARLEADSSSDENDKDLNNMNDNSKLHQTKTMETITKSTESGIKNGNDNNNGNKNIGNTNNMMNKSEVKKNEMNEVNSKAIQEKKMEDGLNLAVSNFNVSGASGQSNASEFHSNTHSSLITDNKFDNIPFEPFNADSFTDGQKPLASLMDTDIDDNPLNEMDVAFSSLHSDADYKANRNEKMSNESNATQEKEIDNVKPTTKIVITDATGNDKNNKDNNKKKMDDNDKSGQSNVIMINNVNNNNETDNEKSDSENKEFEMSISASGTPDDFKDGPLNKPKLMDAHSKSLGTLRKDEIKWKDLQVGERIGIGGFAEVFKGKMSRLPQTSEPLIEPMSVAIKRMIHQNLTKSSLIEFISEVSIMREVNHPNIVKFIGACTKPPHLCLVTELLEMSLFDLLHNTRIKLSWEIRTTIALGAARGVEFLHEKKVIHRDLKSANILLDKHFEPRISDFGLSRMKDEFDTMTAQTGTFQWMSPEVILGKKYTEKVDIYSLAIIFWEIVTSKIPFASMGLNGIQASVAVVTQRKRPQIDSKFPKEWKTLIERCWAHDPSKRLTATECVEWLEEIETKSNALI